MTNTRYVQITREEIEEWLDFLGMKWDLKEDTQGVYFLHLPQSKIVSIRFTSTVGRSQSVRSVGKASMELALVSRKKDSRGFYSVLNKKDVGQKFYRTKNWRDTLGKAIDNLKSVFIASKDFYEKIADKEVYVKTWIEKIHKIPEWQTRKETQVYLRLLDEGKILSSYQESQVEELIVKGVRQVAPDPTTTAIQENKEPLLNRMRILYQKVKEDGDSWATGFVESVGKQYKTKPLSEKQLLVLERYFKKYKI